MAEINKSNQKKRSNISLSISSLISHFIVNFITVNYWCIHKFYFSIKDVKKGK